MNNNNDNEVFTLWCQSKLDDFTILSIKSWLTVGYKVKLYSYESIDKSSRIIFEGQDVEFLNANHILQESMVTSCEHYANIADYFRFSRLEQEGGIWLDSDLVLLKRLPNSAIIISSERCKAIGAFVPKNRDKTPNIGCLKFPPLHPLISYTVTQIEKRLLVGTKEVNNNNNSLMKIFQRRVVKFKHIYWNHVTEPNVYCPINWSYVKEMYHKPDLVIDPLLGLKESFKFGMVQYPINDILERSVGIHLWRNIYNNKGYNETITPDCVFNRIKKLVELNYETKKN